MASDLILTPISSRQKALSRARASWQLAVRRPLSRLVARGEWPPLNGQARRRETIDFLVETYQPDLIVETGTNRGASTLYLSSFGVPVVSAEVSSAHFFLAQLRLRRRENVTLALGSSPLLLERLCAQDAGRHERPLFYLDAHWREYLPLREELDLIWEHWAASVVIVDDCRVPGDAGYGFDDYGAGKRIDVEYCSPPPEVDICFPASPALDETGARRGTCYLGKGLSGREALDAAVAGELLTRADRPV